MSQRVIPDSAVRRTRFSELLQVWSSIPDLRADDRRTTVRQQRNITSIRGVPRHAGAEDQIERP